jgi:transcriptional regulator with XRE-family HTH domain
MTELSDRLLEAREYIGFTREGAAAALECSPALVAALEEGGADPGPEMLEKLGRLYRRPVTWFRGEFRFEPGPGITRMLEGVKDPGDREAILDFAEFLAGTGKLPDVEKLIRDRGRR